MAQQGPARARTDQAALADGLRAVAPAEAVYVRPAGAPFVFLHRAQRHVAAPQGVASLEDARAGVGAWRARFALPADWPAYVALAPGEEPPAWAAGLGPPREAGDWRLLLLPP